MRRFVVLLIAALAMVGTLPGRTQGLGLITEPLLKDLALDRVVYANLNLGATLLGGLFCLGVGQLVDKVGSRLVLTTIALLLGTTVVAMAGLRSGLVPLFVFLVLVRGLGQSALSVVSLAMVGQWFRTGIERAMAAYTVVMTIGFMIAFPVIESVIRTQGWRTAWSGFGWGLIVVLTPLALLAVGKAPMPRSANEQPLPTEGATLSAALRTPAFWVMGLASALYGLIASGIGLFNESVLIELGFSSKVYATTLAVTALTALIGNFLGGYLATRRPLHHLMAIAMLLLMLGLALFPVAHSLALVMGIAVLMGVAGGFVMVLFFSVWAHAFGRAHLGKIQGAAQLLTVVASAVGPLALAAVHARTGSYASVFFVLAGVVALFAVLCWRTPVPTHKNVALPL